jgi:hypothetical protein
MRGPLWDSEIQPQIPTELRPDLNVGLRFLDSYAVPFFRRTQGGIISRLISNVASSEKVTRA